MRDCAVAGLDQWVRDSRGTPTQAWVAGLCGSGTDLCGTGRERDQNLVPRRALAWERTDSV